MEQIYIHLMKIVRLPISISESVLTLPRPARKGLVLMATCPQMTAEVEDAQGCGGFMLPAPAPLIRIDSILVRIGRIGVFLCRS